MGVGLTSEHVMKSVLRAQDDDPPQTNGFSAASAVAVVGVTFLNERGDTLLTMLGLGSRGHHLRG